MRYLRKFNESSDMDDIISDICLELNDEGFRTKFETSYKNGISGRRREILIDLFHSHPGKTFNYDQIKDTIERILKYLGNNLIKIEYIDSSKYQISTLSKNIHSTLNNKDLYQLKIEYINIP